MAKIYITHHSADSDYVRELSERLHELGHSVLFSHEESRLGLVWESSLKSAFRESDALLAIVSEKSAQSKWLISETSAALGYYSERGKPVVLPIILENVKIPISLGAVRCLVTTGRSTREVADKIDRMLDSLLGEIAAKEEERREAITKVETTAATYIQSSIKDLKAREKGYRKVAYFWYGLALFSLVGGLAFGIWRAVDLDSAPKDPSWESLAELGLITVLVVGVLGALSRFAFLLGKAFMVESLRNADRIHAISFGEFYLNAFGDKADWAEVKEAFQHWNIDKGSTFIEQDAKDVDPQILQTALDIAKAISGNS